MWALPRSGDGRWIIAQRPSNRTREQRGVLVLRRHHRPEARDAPEVARRRQRDERPATAVRGVGDRPLLAFGEPGEARVLAAPDLLGMVLGVGAEQGLRIERPAGHAVGAARDVELRDAAQVLDPREQDRLVADPGSARVEDRVGRIGHVGDGQDRVRFRPLEQHRVFGACHRVDVGAEGSARTPPRWFAPSMPPIAGASSRRPSSCAARASRCRRIAGPTVTGRVVPAASAAAADRSARMCSSATSHISVDSAPWFWFTPFGSRPSKPAPRAGSATATPTSLPPRNQA